MDLFEFSENRRVLVIDDNSAIHEDYRKILGADQADSDLNDLETLFLGVSPEQSTTLDLELDSAYQGAEALNFVLQSVVDRRPYALAFVDMRMPPGWNGLETIEKIWEVDPDIQVVICSAHSDQSWSEIIGRLGKSEQFLILKKPFEIAEVLQCAASLIQKWNLARQTRHLLREREKYTTQLEDRVRRQTIAIRDAYEDTIHQLVRASMFRDKETGAHIRRVGLFSEVLARAAGWSDETAEQMRLAAPMHDIGKLAIPDSILQKPGRLTRVEYRIMQQHTSLGAHMLAGSKSPLLRMGREIAISHHERWDGSGYPRGLKGKSIPECGRMVGIVDVYDALSNDRVYRRALTPEATMSELLAGRGTHHDPELLDVFISVLPEMKKIGHENPDEYPALLSSEDPDDVLFATAEELRNWPTGSQTAADRSDAAADLQLHSMAHGEA